MDKVAEARSCNAFHDCVVALLVLFPDTGYLRQRRAARRAFHEYKIFGDVCFLKQTIANACGMYAILHAACNAVLLLRARIGRSIFYYVLRKRKLIVAFADPSSVIGQLNDIFGRCGPKACVEYIQASGAMARIYESEIRRHLTMTGGREEGHCPSCVSAVACDAVCDNLPDVIAHHVVTYAISPETGILYELDGNALAPQPKRCQLRPDEDLLSPQVTRALVRDFREKFGRQVVKPCSTLALVAPA